MTTINTILASNIFTENEINVLTYLNSALINYFGETYSDQDCNDIAQELKLKVASVKGIVGSLVKKDILFTWDTGTGFEVVSFVGQEAMTFEPRNEVINTTKETVTLPDNARETIRKGKPAVKKELAKLYELFFTLNKRHFQITTMGEMEHLTYAQKVARIDELTIEMRDVRGYIFQLEKSIGTY